MKKSMSIDEFYAAFTAQAKVRKVNLFDIGK